MLNNGYLSSTKTTGNSLSQFGGDLGVGVAQAANGRDPRAEGNFYARLQVAAEMTDRLSARMENFVARLNSALTNDPEIQGGVPALLDIPSFLIQRAERALKALDEAEGALGV